MQIYCFVKHAPCKTVAINAPSQHACKQMTLFFLFLLANDTSSPSGSGNNCNNPNEEPTIILAFEDRVKQEVDTLFTTSGTVFQQVNSHYPSSTNANSATDNKSSTDDLMSLMQSSSFGIAILAHFEKHNHLTESLINSLNQIVIDNQIYHILTSANISLQNPLPKLS